MIFKESNRVKLEFKISYNAMMNMIDIYMPVQKLSV